MEPLITAAERQLRLGKEATIYQFHVGSEMIPMRSQSAPRETGALDP
jgi:hypothetical protein